MLASESPHLLTALEDDIEPVRKQVLFDDLVGYSSQNDPSDGGAGVVVGADDASVTLSGNLWQRAALAQAYTVTEDTLLTFEVQLGTTVGELVGVGFDTDENPFDQATTDHFIVGGTQNINNAAFTDLRGTPAVTDLGNGRLRVQVDLSELAGDTLTSLIVFADDDAAGNGLGEATFENVYLEEPDPAGFAQRIQLEARDGSVVISDTVGTTGTDLTQPRDAQNPEPDPVGKGSDGLWDDFNGTGYLDMGANVGDQFSFDIEVPSTGTYSFAFRYGNGSTIDRDMSISLSAGGAVQDLGTVPFVPTPAWDDWQIVTVDLDLIAGVNTITMANTITAGPNLDQVTVTRPGLSDVEPGPRDTIKINFQAADAPLAEDYLVDQFEGFADRDSGYAYGWVTETSAIDADGTTANPIDRALYPSFASFDRVGAPFDSYDPRLTSIAFFNVGAFYPAGEANRTAWQIALTDGFYEVTVSIGDTVNNRPSQVTLFVEGDLVTSFASTDLFSTQLVTAVVEVTDGFLTVSAQGGTETEIQYIEIRDLPDLTPDDGNPAPDDYASFTDARAVSGVGTDTVVTDLDPGAGVRPEGIDPTADFLLGLDIVDGRGGALLESLNDGSIKLFETLTGEEVAFGANTTGGFDSLTISPTDPLKPFTSYTLVIDGFQDRGPNADETQPTREFEKFTTTFVTGETPPIVDREVAFADIVEIDGAGDGAFAYTSIEMSPDMSQLYVTTLGGEIKRWDIDPLTGAIDKSSEETFTPGGDFDTAEGRRGFIGITFDPTDPNTIWVSDNAPIPLNGRDNGVPDFSGRISKVELGAGGSLENASISTYITGLPRSNGDHVSNSLEFRENPNFAAEGGPEYLLYFVQGSNSAMGEPDSAWGFRPERLLNAAVMEIDPTREAPASGFDVSTEPLPDDGNNRRFEDTDNDLKNGGIAIDSGPFTGNFLHFDENGVASVRAGADPTSDLVQQFYDPFEADAVLTLFATGQRNGYDLLWHSNGFLYVPANGSAAGGNVPDDPNTAEDEGVIGVGNQDDYLFRIVEDGYYGHPNALRDEFVQSGGNPTAGVDPNEVEDYEVGIAPDPNYDLEGSYSLGQNRSPNGVIEYTGDAFGDQLKGAVLFTEYSSGNDIRAILVDTDGVPLEDFVLARPDGTTITYADPLDLIQGPAGRIYLLTLNRTTGESQIVRLDPAPGSDFIDALDFVVLDTDDGTLIRDIDDPSTHEAPNSGNDDNGDGLNDGFNGRGYLDPNGGAENKAVFTYNAPVAGSYEVTFRMANGGIDQPRPILILANGQFVEIADTNTGDFTNWKDFTFGLNLVEGDNQVFIQQTGDVGSPNIDSASFRYVGIEGNLNADIEIEPQDPAFLDNRLHFSYLRDPSEEGGSGRDRDFKDTGVVRITNSGTENLEFIDAEIKSFARDDATIKEVFRLADPDIFDGLVLAAGEFIDVTVDFKGSQASGLSSLESGVIKGLLTLTTNDADNPIVTVDLAGFWQNRAEDGFEANVNEVWEIFGFGNFIEGLSLRRGGEESVLSTNDVYAQNDETEVLSPYWKIADGFTEATITQLASFHGPGGASIGIHNTNGKNGDNDNILFTHRGDANQTLLPIQNNGQFASASFGVSDIPASNIGLDYFGIEIANLSTDPTLNLTGNILVGKDGTEYTKLSNDEAQAPNGTIVQIDDLDLVQQGHTVKVLQALDSDGFEIADTYLLIMDYTGINYDYNDNMFVVEGIAPVGVPEDIEITGFDDAAVGDRLVFSRIINPVAGQEFRDEATIEIANDGFGPLSIQSLTFQGPDASAFQLANPPAANTVIPAGGTLSLTVQFIGGDPANDGAAVAYDSALQIVSNDSFDPEVTIGLSGLAQIESENGEEPTVAQILAAFGYGTDVAQNQLANGGIVETVGDEVLAPYFERLDTDAPVEFIQLASYLNQGDVSSLNVFGREDDDLGLLYTSDASQGQTVLPDAQGGNSVARAGFSPNIPFGVKITVAGKPTFAAWSDPVANLADPALTSVDTSEGHYIRYFEAKDAEGDVITGTYIGIQDYPGGGNFDYNDHVFLIKNVTPYALTADDDFNLNGVNDALERDSDGDGTVDFFDTVAPSNQTAFNQGGVPWLIGQGGLELLANAYDNGGQGVAYSDAPGLQGGSDGGRAGSSVEISITGAVGWVANGEWLEYTVNVAEAGTYALTLETALGTASGPDRSITASFDGGLGVYESVTFDVDPNGSWTSFTDTQTLNLALNEGEQVLRLTFEGGSQNLLALDFDYVGPAQTPFGGTAPVIDDLPVKIDATNFDEGGQGFAYNDDPGLDGGPTTPRDGRDVELAGSQLDVAYVENGEWVEYTVDVQEAGAYLLSVEAKSPKSGNTITASIEDGEALATFALPDSNGGSNSFNGTSFAETDPQEIALAAGLQTLRFTFDGTPSSNGYLLDLRSFTLEQAPDAGLALAGGDDLLN